MAVYAQWSQLLRGPGNPSIGFYGCRQESVGKPTSLEPFIAVFEYGQERIQEWRSLRAFAACMPGQPIEPLAE